MANLDLKSADIKLDKFEIIDQLTMWLKDEIGGAGSIDDYKIMSDDTVYLEYNLSLQELKKADKDMIELIKLTRQMRSIFYKHAQKNK